MRRGLLSIVAAALMLAGCAGGQPPGAETALAPDMARLYVYRELDANGSLVWTEVMLDHRKIGDCGPGTVFYRDLPPGVYEIEVRSDQIYPGQFRTVRLTAGSRTFAEIQQAAYWGDPSYESQGATFAVRIVEPSFGARQIEHLSLTSG
jgi:hypothetical protein